MIKARQRANSPELRKKESLYSKRYIQTHPETRSEIAKRHYQTHREAILTYTQESNRRWRSNNPDKVREKSRRRRALQVGSKVGTVDERLVIEKAEGVCQRCGILVPERLRQIDHIIPLSKGGTHTQDNLQLLCRDCNLRKGAKLPDEF